MLYCTSGWHKPTLFSLLLGSSLLYRNTTGGWCCFITWCSHTWFAWNDPDVTRLRSPLLPDCLPDTHLHNKRACNVFDMIVYANFSALETTTVHTVPAVLCLHRMCTMTPDVHYRNKVGTNVLGNVLCLTLACVTLLPRSRLVLSQLFWGIKLSFTANHSLHAEYICIA